MAKGDPAIRPASLTAEQAKAMGLDPTPYGGIKKEAPKKSDKKK